MLETEGVGVQGMAFQEEGGCWKRKGGIGGQGASRRAGGVYAGTGISTSSTSIQLDRQQHQQHQRPAGPAAAARTHAQGKETRHEGSNRAGGEHHHPRSFIASSAARLRSKLSSCSVGGGAAAGPSPPCGPSSRSPLPSWMCSTCTQAQGGWGVWVVRAAHPCCLG